MNAMTKLHVLAIAALFALAGCDDNPAVLSDGAVIGDRPVVDAATCFAGTPHTRLEFLNRCTDAETVTKTVVLPLRRADGSLPPLP